MRSKRIAQLREALTKRILVLDGAMGTAIQNLHLSEKAYGGRAHDGCHEHLSLTNPEEIAKIHREHLAAGADILETNTFGGTPLVLGEFELSEKAVEINRTAALIARKAADSVTTPEHPRFVAGSMGPTTKSISVTGGISFDELSEHYYLQAQGLWAGGCDYLLLETCQDTCNVKAGVAAIHKLAAELKEEIPIAISGTIEPMGTMLAGQSIDALLTSVSHLPLLYLGLNCATGPQFMTDHIRSLASLCPFPIACVPNAGLPDEDGNYIETPQMMVDVLSRFIENEWINLIGGCCGTTPAHTQAFVELTAGKKARIPKPMKGSYLSGIDCLEVRGDRRPLLVGERTNVIGSRAFKKLILAEEYEQAAEIGKSQAQKGAAILDVCLADPDRDELKDMTALLRLLARKVRTPFMLDSTDPIVLKEALKLCQGKSLINSINLEDGEERFEKVIPLAKEFGAALVVGLIDEDPKQGMAVTAQRKLEVARRSFDLLTKKYGVSPADIYWDPLVFPCGTGDENYKGSARHTIEGVRKMKEHFPETKTVLGISNVSFGLPPVGREVLNSVFLHHCVQAGLDLAIVNSEKLERYSKISAEDRELCDRLIDAVGADPIGAFNQHFGNKQPSAAIDNRLPLDERLHAYILNGTKDGLIKDLQEKLKSASALEIINGPLMRGMDEVGRLFGENKLIVAEVLQSAEAMKAAVSFLEPHLNKQESASRGKILLATVKGDVHDIGKNLVEIILANNGFQVINLGIKVPPDQLIDAIGKHQPDIVGLSGLLVKSAQQMVATASDFARAGIKTPILVGGAALSSNFVDKKISEAYSTGTVAYAQDAMQGLDLAKQIVDPQAFDRLKKELSLKREKLRETAPLTQKPKVRRTERAESVPILNELPEAPDFTRHVLKMKTPIDQIFDFINPMMLYGRHLGVRGGTVKLLTASQRDRGSLEQIQSQDPKGYEIWEAVSEMKNAYRETPFLRPNAIFQFFRASSKGNQISLFNSAGSPIESFHFPRMDKNPFLCLSDFVHPKDDNLALFVVTVGQGVREESERLKEKGDYLRSHILQVLALECAEAYAEWIHAQIRRMWGFGDPPEMTMLERFQAKYRGKRYSFGYPACPDLSDQKKLFGVLKPADIGVELTDGFMMDPEASVSAVVFHHPSASYFSVGQGALEEEG